MKKTKEVNETALNGAKRINFANNAIKHLNIYLPFYIYICIPLSPNSPQNISPIFNCNQIPFHRYLTSLESTHRIL